MSSTGLKEYTLKINGVTTSINDVTKLEDAVKSLNSVLDNSNKISGAAARVSNSKTKALTDEEKAAKKLRDTRERLANADSEANKLQIEATQQLRERNREISRQVAQNNLAEGSVRAMGMSLTDLRNEWENLSAEERNNVEIGGELLKQIQALDVEYKALRESTGNFRDSVGNYGRAVEGVGKLTTSVQGARDATVGLATDVLGTERALAIFGNTADGGSDSLATLQKIILLATAAQGIYTAATESGIIADGVAATVTGVKTLQTKAFAAAQVLATRNTIAATAAQRIFNIVAAANPYVLIAAALVTVVGLLIAFTRNTDSASAAQSKLNALHDIWLEQLDREGERLAEVGERRIKLAERSLELLQAQGDVIRRTNETEESYNKRRAARLQEVRTAENRIAIERARNNAAQRGFYGNEIANLEKNRQKLEEFRDVLHQLKLARERGETTIQVDVDLDGNIDLVKVNDAIESVQGRVDRLGKQVDLAVRLTDEQEDIEQQAAVIRERRLAEDRATAQAIKDQQIADAKERRQLEREAIRQGEDARIAAMRNTFERERATIDANAKRAIEDIKVRLKEETNLTKAARAALSASIVDIQRQQANQLEDLERQYWDRALEIQRAAEDSRLLLLKDAGEKQRQEIENTYYRQREELHKQLAREESLTMEEREHLTEQIINLEKAKNLELDRINAQAAQDRVDFALNVTETQLAQVQARIKNIVDKGVLGDKLINVEQTRANAAAVNNALQNYINGLRVYQNDLSEVHAQTLETLQQGTPEYQAEVKKYSDAMEAATVSIIEAQRQQTANAKIAKDAQIRYWAELTEKIAGYAAVGAEVIGGFTDAWSLGLSFAIDSLNEQLDAIEERYDKATKAREEAVKNTQELEAKLQQATGATSEAVKRQLQESVLARKEAEREEARLAKEKEKREAEIRKKEKQQRRADLVAGIAQSIANTAQGVTKALASIIWPLNFVVAGLIGAAGGAQVGLMTRQLTKLQKGGKIKGASHAQGGVPIQGTNYEVEGDEMITNKVSTASNEPLLNLINSTPSRVPLADIMGLYADQAPNVAVNDIVQNNDDRILDALEAIDFKPVVSVEDINDGQRRVAEVKDISGFN